PRTTSRIVCSDENTPVLTDENASSRLGPTVPVDFASASVWQDEHDGSDGFAGCRKSCLPCAGSPSVTRPTAPQPDASSASRTTVSAKALFRVTRTVGWRRGDLQR